MAASRSRQEQADRLSRKVSRRGVVNGGLYLFRTAFLRALYRLGPLSIEHELIPQMIEAGANLHVVCPQASPLLTLVPGKLGRLSILSKLIYGLSAVPLTVFEQAVHAIAARSTTRTLKRHTRAIR